MRQNKRTKEKIKIKIKIIIKNKSESAPQQRINSGSSLISINELCHTYHTHINNHQYDKQ